MAEKAVLAIKDGRNVPLANAPLKKYKVQYNPSELSISAGEPPDSRDEDKLQKKGTGRKYREVQYSSEEYSIRITIPLIFDRTEEYIRSREKTGNPDWESINVRTEAEAFIAMVRNSNIRFFIFSWGLLCYSGELISVSGQYTMFAESGAPIRASVSLTMRCKDIDNGNQWASMYNLAFGNKKKLSMASGKDMVRGLKKAVIKVAKAKYSTKDKKFISQAGGFCELEVQYNPNSLSLRAAASSRDNSDDSDEKNTEISFQLIFDKTEEENQSDVAVITNGIISLMTDKVLTEAEFRWGTMSFAGNLTSVQSKFTMFSSEGVPLRSSIDISIVGDVGEDVFDKLTEKKYGGV